VSATRFAAPSADGLADQHPEWRRWLAVLDVTASEATVRAWDDAVPGEPAGTAPALGGATLVIERAVAERWVARLFRAADAPELHDVAARADALAVIEAAANLDAFRLEGLATAAGAPPDAFGAVAPLAALPWLQACGQRWGAAADAGRGWCGVCAAWPALAEARGLEGERRLRCARCGGDWRTPWLACSFCGNDDHTRLASLVAETTGESRKVDACQQCGGYLKTVTTLSGADAPGLRLLDLSTVDLDVAALDRGFIRPAGLGHPLAVTVVERRVTRPFRRR
jgi:FdhE protein